MWHYWKYQSNFCTWLPMKFLISFKKYYENCSNILRLAFSKRIDPWHFICHYCKHLLYKLIVLRCGSITSTVPCQRHNRLSTAWVQLTQSLYQRLLMWYTGLPVRQSQSSNLFSLVQSKGKRKKGSLAITRESWEEVSDWSKSSPVQFGEVVFSLKIRTQTALWYQTQLIWEVGWVVPNFKKTRWQVVMSFASDIYLDTLEIGFHVYSFCLQFYNLYGKEKVDLKWTGSITFGPLQYKLHARDYQQCKTSVNNKKRSLLYYFPS